MTPTDDHDAALARARQRLAHSRQALLEQMRMGSTAHTPTDRAPNDDGQDGLWSWLMQACQNHPGLLALQALAPLLRERMRHHPWQVLALSGLLGGALVLLRPWRLLPTGALLMTAARAVPLGQLLSAWLRRAHHEPANEPPNKRPQKQGGNQGSKRSD
jgi:hypothetical protein